MDAEGRIKVEQANPWALRFEEDMLTLRTMEDSCGFVEDIDRRYALVFVSDEWSEDFVKFDMSWFRKATLGVAIAPPGLTRELDNEVTPNIGAADASGVGYTCGCYGCPAWFETKQQIQMHLRISHEMRCLSYVCCVSNICPVCETVFASRTTAQRHLDKSICRGHCIPNRTHTLTDIQIPTSLACPLCELEAGEVTELCSHIRSAHLPLLGVGRNHGRR